MFPNLVCIMAKRGVRAYQLAALLKLSAPTMSLRLTGRQAFLPIERIRLSEFFGVTQEWLFTELTVPASARIETTLLRPANLEVR